MANHKRLGRMSIFKQLLGMAATIALAIAIWGVMAPASFSRALNWASISLTGGEYAAAMAPARAGNASRRGGRGAPASSLVLTAPVGLTVSNALVQALGTGVAEKSITLFAHSGGRVREVMFRAGERVEEGQILARLDDDDQRIGLDQVKIKLETARLQVERFERLAKSQAVTVVQLQDARNAVKTLENELAAAELALSRRSVRAPFSGVTGLAQISVGDVITTTSAITTLDDRSVLHVRFSAPERFAAHLSVGKKLSATSVAFGDEIFTGEIESIDSRIDPAARNLTVRARFANSDDRLRPGMSFAITIDIDGEKRLAIPALALQWDRAGAYVWKFDGTRVRRVEVTVLDRTADSVLISGDLDAADRVVTEGVQTLRDGAEVEAAEATKQVRAPS